MKAWPSLPTFDGFYVGPVAAAVLLAFGTELIVVTVQVPLTMAVMGAVNFAIRAGDLAVVPLRPPAFSWIISASTFVPGIAALLIGFRFAAWLSKGKAK
jgi:hypothetical protein